MKNFLEIHDFSKNEMEKIFSMADNIEKYYGCLKNKTIVLFFPESSIRTRASFEKGIYLLGGQPILFPKETLDKREEMKDVAGYLNDFAEGVIIRHNNIELIKEFAKYSDVPVINAMTDVNHPCEIMSDLYALSKIRKDYLKDKYLYMGPDTNVGKTWAEVAKLLDMDMELCCPRGLEIDASRTEYDINKAFIGKDVILTDSVSKSKLDKFDDYLITTELMEKANKGAILNPCPPFYRGEIVTAEVIDKYFVGYEFKKALLCVQQAILLYCLGIE